MRRSQRLAKNARCARYCDGHFNQSDCTIFYKSLVHAYVRTEAAILNAEKVLKTTLE